MNDRSDMSFVSSHLHNHVPGVLPTVTGGETFYYFPFVAERDGPRLVNDVGYLVSRNFGYEALMRMRCSTGKWLALINRVPLITKFFRCFLFQI